MAKQLMGSLILTTIFAAASGCSSFQVKPMEPSLQKTLVQQKLMGHWKTAEGSQIDLWCNGSVSVEILEDEIHTFSLISHSGWTGGITQGNGKISDFQSPILSVEDLFTTHHWEFKKLPQLNENRSYSMTVEGLDFTALRSDLLDCTNPKDSATLEQ